MLCLTRGLDQRIVLDTQVGEKITIVVTRIKANGQVELGIEAPDSVLIRRGELNRPSRASLPQIIREAKTGAVDVNASLERFFADRPSS